ncbi:MAG: efflux RND transporter periplasmic adaptor subunit [Patescibacteria group bacterium]
MKNILKQKKVWIGIAVLLVGGLFFVFRSGKSSAGDTLVIVRTNLVQEVSVTGTVKPAANADLAFDRSGRISYANVRVGDIVGAGQVLVSLENGDFAGALQEAEANVKAEQAKLDELKQGTRPEEIVVQEIKVRNARTSLGDAKNNVIDKTQDAYTKSNDAIRGKADAMFTNPQSQAPQLSFVTGLGTKSTLEFQRLKIEKILTTWNEVLLTGIQAEDFPRLILSSRQNLQEISSFLDVMTLALSSVSSGSGLSQTTLDSWKSDLSTARTNVNTALTNLSAAEEKLRSAESALALTEQELALKKAGSTSEQIMGQEAQLERVRAAVRSASANLGKTIIRAPISGVLTKQDAKAGEIATAGQVLVSMIGNSGFEIEANVPEADIAKIALSDSARVTLDAYGSEVEFPAIVVKIDPAETIVDGVPTYKVTLQFKEKDERIRSGMTANTDIITDSKDNIFTIPQRAIKTKDGKKYVSTKKGEAEEEIEITTGIRGSNGYVEVLTGLREGDTVILDAKK